MGLKLHVVLLVMCFAGIILTVHGSCRHNRIRNNEEPRALVNYLRYNIKSPRIISRLVDGLEGPIEKMTNSQIDRLLALIDSEGYLTDTDEYRALQMLLMGCPQD
ncbi:hypothetical protein HOLleu_08145 [Holothuria leucospilota]|uniref:Uncharacterized protein n=1 Tax=Holothuria leucospilota TaxID=206669 RepID=A0A9Q1HD97_HOLLE|nr:hypothetical protein HOLleu_08145 [Holothuria leucospilota]